jgi:hypothetical protein
MGGGGSKPGERERERDEAEVLEGTVLGFHGIRFGRGEGPENGQRTTRKKGVPEARLQGLRRMNEPDQLLTTRRTKLVPPVGML